MHQEKLEELLNKHRNKIATPKEEILLQSWTEKVNKLSQQEEVFSNAEEEERLGRKMWNRISPAAPIKLSIHRFSYLMCYAAIIAGISLMSWFFYNNYKTTLTNDGSTAVLWDTVSAAPQMIKQLILADGSEVYLNAGSQVRYRKIPDLAKREIELLYGEARFSVVHDVKRPFLVYCRGIKTLVLGTQFTVSGYANLPDIKVDVHSGKVAVSTEEKLLAQLIKGEGLVYNIHNRLSIRYAGNEGLFDPVKQIYYLKNASFEELALRIRNTYGYELKASRARVKDAHFTGELNFKESINVTMHNFSRIYGGSFTIQGKEIQMH